MKYLLLFFLFGVIWWAWKKRRQERWGEKVVRHEMQPEKMLLCAHCGVHFPEGDAVSVEGKFYCSEAHRQAALRSAGE